ncbi:hypothetical protein N9Z41_00235 [bacterium]|nr:hypothetical protein [bacterium]
MAQVRFIDQLKVGAYEVQAEGTSITINNNVDNYVLTATGQNDIINGEAQLQFDGVNLGVGGASAGARLEVNDTTNSDLMLIKNSNTGQGIKVDNTGILSLIEFSSLPTAVAGGFIYSSDEFWIGVSS